MSNQEKKPERKIGEILTSLSKNPKYENANADYLIRRLRLEFNKHSNTHECRQRTAANRSISQTLKNYRSMNSQLGGRGRRKRSILHEIFHIFFDKNTFFRANSF